MDAVTRHVLMVELPARDAQQAADILEDAFPNLRVWGEVDPVDAALLVVTRDLAAA